MSHRITSVHAAQCLLVAAFVVWTLVAEALNSRWVSSIQPELTDQILEDVAFGLLLKHCDTVSSSLKGGFVGPITLLSIALALPTALEVKSICMKFGKNDCRSFKNETARNQGNLGFDVSHPQWHLSQVKKDAHEETCRHFKEGFTVVQFLLATLLLVFDIIPAMFFQVSGTTLACVSARAVIVPLYKPCLPIWVLLFMMLQYVQWERTRTITPQQLVLSKQQLDTDTYSVVPIICPFPWGTRPCNRNLILDTVGTFVALLVAAWCCFAMPVLPAIVGFAPVAAVLLLALPFSLMLAPLMILSALSYRVLNIRLQQQQGQRQQPRTMQTMLKSTPPAVMTMVGIVVVVVVVVVMSQFTGFYYGSDVGSSWVALTRSALSQLALSMSFVGRHSYVDETSASVGIAISGPSLDQAPQPSSSSSSSSVSSPSSTPSMSCIICVVSSSYLSLGLSTLR